MPNSESHAPADLPPSAQRTIDELAGHCFGCGPHNPQGLHVHFTISSDDPENLSATATVNLTRLHEGAPGFLHGGIIATLLDEAMSKLNRPLNVLAMTRHMSVDYLRPVPLGVDVTLIGRHLSRSGRKLHHEAELIHPDGTILARGKALFVAVDPALLTAALK